MSAAAIQLVHSKKETAWKQITCEEAAQYVNTHVVWWRPNKSTYSKDPGNDIAWIVED